MAKKDAKEKKTVATKATDEAGKGSGKGRTVFITFKGKEVKRADFIRQRYYDENVERGDIARELTELTGETVAYQIVFASTKVKREDWAAHLKGEASKKAEKEKTKAAEAAKTKTDKKAA